MLCVQGTVQIRMTSTQGAWVELPINTEKVIQGQIRKGLKGYSEDAQMSLTLETGQATEDGSGLV